MKIQTTGRTLSVLSFLLSKLGYSSTHAEQRQSASSLQRLITIGALGDRRRDFDAHAHGRGQRSTRPISSQLQTRLFR